MAYIPRIRFVYVILIYAVWCGGFQAEVPAYSLCSNASPDAEKSSLQFQEPVLSFVLVIYTDDDP
jgi:hypothetical protein